MAIQRKSLLILSVFFILILTMISTANAEKLDLSFDDVEFAQIFRILGESQDLNVLVDPNVLGAGTFRLKGVSFAEALELISHYSGYAYSLKGNTLVVTTAERLKDQEQKDVRYVKVDNLTTNEVKEALALVMPTSDIYVQSPGGLVVLQGAKGTLDRAEDILLALDTTDDNLGESRSLLDIFKELSVELDLNLVADPALEKTRIHLDVRQQNPEELIRQIQQLVPLKVEMTASSLLVGNLDVENGERLKVYRLDHVDPEATKEALSLLVSTERIRVDAEHKSIIIRGTEKEFAEADQFLLEFDVPARQVRLEVWVQEVSTDAMRNLGIDFVGTPSFSGGDAPVFMEIKWEPWELLLKLRALEDAGDAKLLANPQIATLSGKEASIFVGDRVPIILSDEDGSRSVQFLESGINLKVTPRIADNEEITIIVKPEVSTFVWRSDTEYPQIRTREAETTVRVKDGQPIVIGGLLQEQETELITQIPFLAELPVLGKLFQWKETKREQTEMTIFLIPTIIEGNEGVVSQGFFPPAQ